MHFGGGRMPHSYRRIHNVGRLKKHVAEHRNEG